MTTIYKLTDQDMRTHNGFQAYSVGDSMRERGLQRQGLEQWTLNKEETASGKGGLCGPGFLHAYTDPLLAILLNPIHADIKSPRLFKGTGTVSKTDNGLKIGCTEMTLTEEMELPVINIVQRIAFGILCTKEVYKDKDWNTWADNWLSGKDRTEATAEAAARAARAARATAEAAARAATAEAAAWEAAEAAEAAAAAAAEAWEAAEAAAAEARAARAAAEAAEEATEAAAAEEAKEAARAAAEAAWAAAEAEIDLIACAEKAMRVRG